MKKLAVVAVVVAGMLGCSRKDADKGQPATTASAVTSATPKLEKPVSIPMEVAQAALTSWVEAQNRNSFEEYKGLYGEPFVGIKRTGNVEKQFQLAGWLEDRQQLFQRNPLVTVENVKVMTTTSTAIVEFDQTWKTARFQDFGRKRLVLVRDAKDGKLRIGREEMLTSTAGTAKVTRPELPPGAHYFLQPTVGGFGAVLGMMGQAKATGKLTRLDFGHVQRAVNLDTVKSASEMIGTEIDVYSLDGKPCLTKIAGIVAVAEAFIYLEENDPTKDQQTWDIAGDHGTFLVADLKPVNETCIDPMWGRLTSLPKPLVYETRKATAEELQRGILALHRTAQGQEMQRSYLEEKQKAIAEKPGQPLSAMYASPNWYQSEPETSATVMTNPKTKESYINVEVSAMGGPCGGLWAIATFKITGQNLIEITPASPVTAARDIGYTMLSFLPDIGAQLPESAQPVFFNNCLLYAHNGTGWVPTQFVSGPRMMCSC